MHLWSSLKSSQSKPTEQWKMFSWALNISIFQDDTDQHLIPTKLSVNHVSLVKSEVITDQVNPAVEDLLMGPQYLHLPGFEEVEQFALLLVKLTDDTDQHLIPTDFCLQISKAVAALHDHDKSARSFIKKYESKWGYTLFGRCLGQESPKKRAARKRKFSWMKYAQVTEESRLLYIMVKMLKNRPKVAQLHVSSPTKTASVVKAQYKRIADRVRDDPVLSGLEIPLPNINVKSITAFLNREDKKVNFMATTIPKVASHRRVVTDEPIPDAPIFPPSLPSPDRPRIVYPPKKKSSKLGRDEWRRDDWYLMTLMIKRHQPAPVQHPVPVPAP
ncbi:uncharacterized protein [Diadema setosum]|uniref:uncharacterized protein n=1 Tax=Diadema setosum TaxID=31175 RepID=UPI003B3A7821